MALKPVTFVGFCSSVRGGVHGGVHGADSAAAAAAAAASGAARSGAGARRQPRRSFHAGRGWRRQQVGVRSPPQLQLSEP